MRDAASTANGKPTTSRTTVMIVSTNRISNVCDALSIQVCGRKADEFNVPLPATRGSFAQMSVMAWRRADAELTRGCETASR